MKCYFFGTFNPIHSAHLEIARKVREQFNFEDVIFVVAYAPPHKIPDVTPYVRLKMAQLAAGRKNVSDIEFFLPVPSYSYNTVLELKKRDKTERINFIMGYDAFFKIESWKNPQILKDNVNFIIIPRRCSDNCEKSLSHLKERGWKFEIANIDFMNISSNMIRERLYENKDIEGLVEKKTREYIYEHGLYRKQTQRMPERREV